MEDEWRLFTVIKEMGDKERPCAQEAHGALLGIKRKGIREAEETKRKPWRKQRKELNSGRAGRGRKNKTGRKEDHQEAGPTTSVTQGKGWDQTSRFQGTLTMQPALVSLPLLWMKMPLSLEVKLRLFLIFAFQLRHQDLFTRLSTSLLPLGSKTLLTLKCGDCKVMWIQGCLFG